MTKKEQFTEASTTGYTSGNFLLDSLSLIAADTRGSLNEATTERVAQMTQHVNANPDGDIDAKRFSAYIDKITPDTKSSQPQATARAAVKPKSGMM